jgi:hypothetical protein
MTLSEPSRSGREQTMTLAPRVGRRLLALTAVTVVLVGAAACGSSQPAGPVQMTMSDGQPDFDAGGVVVNQGQTADGEADVVNSGQDPVTITAVTVIDLPGWQPGDLLRAAIATTGAGVAGARGWPPPVPEKAAIGGTLPHGLNQIVYGIAGNGVGRYYAIAGVKITYRYQGRSYSMLAWTALVACVAKSWRTGSESLCNAQVQKANTALEKLAG